VSEEAAPATIKFEDFTKVDIRVGEVVQAEPVPKSSKLLKLKVDFGPGLGERTVCAGIAQEVSAAHVLGRRYLFVVNLEPRLMMGIESHGMILAGQGPLGLSLASCECPPGTRIH